LKDIVKPTNVTVCVADQKVARDVKKENVQRTSDSDDMNLPLKFLQLIDRQDLDFTEQLWDILRGVSIVWN